MDPVAALERLGGVAPYADLVQLTSRRRLRTALDHDVVRRSGRDRYVLPAADQARRAAALYGGVVTHLSAALHYGWQVRRPPERPQIALPRGRELPRSTAAEVRPLARRAAVDGWATDHLTTVLLCARDLAFADALAVADSALRHGDLTGDQLLNAARGPREQRVAQHADARAANPFESSLRAITIAAGLGMVPQFEVQAGGVTLHPDLVDPLHGVVLEAESWEFHGREREAFERDCERYNLLVADGWRVLRFTWSQVMYQPEAVTRCLLAVYRDLEATRSPL